MEKIDIFQIDAFTDKIFHGNPAAVCLLDEWLNDELMQAIAVENNLSETAFVMVENDKVDIRWFAPDGEMSLCGHATLAAGFVLFELGKSKSDIIHFNSLSGQLQVRKNEDSYTLDFPKFHYLPSTVTTQLIDIIDLPALEVYDSELDYLVVLADEKQVVKANVDLKALSLLEKRGLILTAKGDDCDFYSRCFYPKHKIPEDPVTGSAHCVLAPYWSERLDKMTLKAVQGLYRKGDLICEVQADRVLISGSCRWYSKGRLVI